MALDNVAPELAKDIESVLISAEEIAASKAAIYPGDVFNPQTQTQVTWPADLAAAAEASRKGG